METITIKPAMFLLEWLYHEERKDVFKGDYKHLSVISYNTYDPLLKHQPCMQVLEYLYRLGAGEVSFNELFQIVSLHHPDDYDCAYEEQRKKASYSLSCSSDELSGLASAGPEKLFSPRTSRGEALCNLSTCSVGVPEHALLAKWRLLLESGCKLGDTLASLSSLGAHHFTVLPNLLVQVNTNLWIEDAQLPGGIIGVNDELTIMKGGNDSLRDLESVGMLSLVSAEVKSLGSLKHADRVLIQGTELEDFGDLEGDPETPISYSSGKGEATQFFTLGEVKEQMASLRARLQDDPAEAPRALTEASVPWMRHIAEQFLQNA